MNLHTLQDCSQIVRSQCVKYETRDSNERSSDIISARNCIHHLKRGILREILQATLTKLLKLPSMFEVDAHRREKLWNYRKYLF